MSTDDSESWASRPEEVRFAAILATIGVWTVAVPSIGDALGLSVAVSGRVEIIDHIVPGALVAVGGLYLMRSARGRPLASGRFTLRVSCVVFLAGMWVLATHLPLLADAATSDQAWDAAIWHAAGALPILVASLWCVSRSIPKSDP
jgi:hypothetical protein